MRQFWRTLGAVMFGAAITMRAVEIRDGHTVIAWLFGAEASASAYLWRVWQALPDDGGVR